MIIRIIENNKYGTKFKENKFNLALHLICLERIKNRDFNLFDEMIKRKLYEFVIFIDDLLYKTINLQSHDIKIYFINNITKDFFIVKRLNLNYHIDKYYYYDNEGEQKFNNNYIIPDSEFIDIQDIDIYDEEILSEIVKYKKNNFQYLKYFFYLFLLIIYIIYFLFKEKTI